MEQWVYSGIFIKDDEPVAADSLAGAAGDFYPWSAIGNIRALDDFRAAVNIRAVGPDHIREQNRQRIGPSALQEALQEVRGNRYQRHDLLRIRKVGLANDDDRGIARGEVGNSGNKSVVGVFPEGR